MALPLEGALSPINSRMDGAHGGIDEIRMQSEPCLPRTILYVCPRQCGEEGAEDRDRFRRTGRTCM